MYKFKLTWASKMKVTASSSEESERESRANFSRKGGTTVTGNWNLPLHQLAVHRIYRDRRAEVFIRHVVTAVSNHSTPFIG
jgi:hypothetical protein